MKGNDLSSVVVPRVILVFEGALGFIPEDKTLVFNTEASRGDWHRAWQCWDINDMMARKIWDVVIRKSLQIEIVTYVGDGSDECLAGLENLIDEHNIPASVSMEADAQTMARELAYRPDVIQIYDANTETAFAYGRRGVLLKNVSMFGEL